jgi:dipeptidyl aminopeptidase/acylaminoacyl peptidase
MPGLVRGFSRVTVILGVSALLLNPFFGTRPGWAGDADTAIETTLSPPAGATLSPSGMRAAWPKENGAGFWIAERAGAKWTRPGQISVRGLVSTPVFSPDGQRLAFENLRGGYSTEEPDFWGPSRAYNWDFIAVYDFTNTRISYLNPSIAQDSDPHWSDNQTVSYTRRFEGAPAVAMVGRVSEQPAGAAAGKSSKNRALLESILGAPLLYQPAHAGDGRSLAYVARAGRMRGIYFAHMGEPARSLIEYPDDDGQALTQLAVSQDGSLVAYVRGGEPNGKGEIPNPRSLATPPKREIWLLNTVNPGPPRLIGTGWDPQFSPDDSRIIWLTERGVANAPLIRREGHVGDVGSASFLLSGPVRTLRIAPDGQRLVYERSGFIEVYDLGTHAGWAVEKPADATDADPAWSPDGRSIALRRDVGHQHHFETGYGGEYVSKEPWAIVVANAATHGTRQIWGADAGTGSAYYPLDQDPTDSGDRGDQLLWSDDEEIAFVWERDGWRHLYAVRVVGGPARLLTPGEGEVEQAAVSLDHQRVIYSTNIGDLERRHLAAVAFHDGAPAPLTAGASSQWAPTPVADGGVAFIDAGWAGPPAVMWQDRQAKVSALRGPESKSFPSAQMLRPQAVTFTAQDGKTAYGQLFVPVKPSGCGVVFVHGGIKRQMLLGFHYMDAYSNLFELNQYFAIRGCTVLSVEYRSSIMRGYAFRNAPGWGTGGASEYLDVLAGAKYLKSRRDLRVERLGIYGLSWGGYLTAQALARNSDVFAAGFDMAGVHNFPGDSFKYSPAAFAKDWRSPVYFAAGDDDRNVDFNQTIDLVKALREKPDPVEMTVKVLPDEVHDLSLTFDDLVDVYWEGSEFLLAHIGQAR